MTSAFPTPCAATGCPEIGREPYCDEHEDLRPKKRTNREDERSARERGYDTTWEKVRTTYIKKHPICQRCEERGGKTNPAELVHHIRPLKQGGARLATENLMSLCSRCHGRVHSRRKDGYARTQIICGPPGAGKTTYAQKNLRWGDLIVDVDLLFAALGGLGPRQKPEAVFPLVMDVRDLLIGKLKHPTSVDRAWVIATAPERKLRRQLAGKLKAQPVVLDVPPEECKRRIESDETRLGQVEEQLKLVDDWWSRYEPWEEDRVIAYREEVAA